MLKKIIRSYYYLKTEDDGLFIYTKSGEFLRTESIERADMWNKETVKDAYKKCKDCGINCKIMLIDIACCRED